jgi:predicted transcriptional regulator
MILAKHCPYCRHLVKVEHGELGGVCDRCGKIFTIKYHLTKIRLQKEFIPRNYETEILAVIAKKGKSYAGELSYKIGASKGVVSITLHNMEAKGLVEVIQRGKTKWIVLPGSNVKIR